MQCRMLYRNVNMCYIKYTVELFTTSCASYTIPQSIICVEIRGLIITDVTIGNNRWMPSEHEINNKVSSYTGKFHTNFSHRTCTWSLIDE